MRRRFAHGLAIVLSVVSLGAAKGPLRSESGTSRISPPSVSEVSSPKPGTKPKPKPYQVGIASWYGSDFQGKATASGEPYNMYDLTAAHPALPLGTWVRVTNLRNGRAILVRVNDRGPIVPGRIIDVSYNAARALNFKSYGLQKVRLDVVPPPQTLAMAGTFAN